VEKKPHAELIEFDEDELGPRQTGGGRAAARAADVLGGGGILSVRIHPQTVEKATAVARAEAALNAVRTELIARHCLPPGAYVEVDDESRGTPVAPFHGGRFLLPHQDGGHCSFLTPSRFDHDDVSPDDRVFSSTVYWKRPSHKMYQGFIITNPGTPPGETYYYDVFALLADAFSVRYGRAPRFADLTAFTLDNIRFSRRHQSTHGSRYVTLGALLGSPELAQHVMPSGPRAESEFWPAQYMAVPALCDMTDRCPCGTCNGPGARVFCHACVQTLGQSWPKMRETYEVAVVGARYDLLIGNNITQLHAALSSASRTIRPMCMVIDRPEGEAYERWLATQWRVGCAASFAGAAPGCAV
jgi:hypothetical protein